jgi:hypothetical protein
MTHPGLASAVTRGGGATISCGSPDAQEDPHLFAVALGECVREPESVVGALGAVGRVVEDDERLHAEIVLCVWPLKHQRSPCTPVVESRSTCLSSIRLIA